MSFIVFKNIIPGILYIKN